MKKILTVLTFLVASNLFAQDNSNVEVLNTVTHNNPEDGNIVLTFFGIASEADERVNNNFNGGLGAFIEFQYDEHLGFETGAFFMSNQYIYSDREINRVSDVRRLHVPVLVKLWPTNFLNFGVGPYASLRVSDEKKILKSETFELIKNGSQRVEYGVDFAGSFILSLNDKTGLFAGLRYRFPIDKRVRDRLENNATILAGFNLQL